MNDEKVGTHDIISLRASNTHLVTARGAAVPGPPIGAISPERRCNACLNVLHDCQVDIKGVGYGLAVAPLIRDLEVKSMDCASIQYVNNTYHISVANQLSESFNAE